MLSRPPRPCKRRNVPGFSTYPVRRDRPAPGPGISRHPWLDADISPSMAACREGSCPVRSSLAVPVPVRRTRLPHYGRHEESRGAVRLCRTVTVSATVIAAALALSATDLPPAFPFGRCRLGQDRAGKAPRLGHREAGPGNLLAAGAPAEVHEDPRGRTLGIAKGEPADREFPPAACAQVLVSPSARGAYLLIRPHHAPPRLPRGHGRASTCHTHLGIGK